MVQEIKDITEFNELIKSGKVILIDFWATWCGPCRVIGPIFEELSKEFGAENVIFAKVDVDACPDISQEVGIRAMPTFHAYLNGKKIGDLVGANPPGLKTLITNAIAKI